MHSVTVDYGGTWTRIQVSPSSGKKLRLIKFRSGPISSLPWRIRSVIKRSKLSKPHYLTVGAKGIWTKDAKKHLFLKLKSLAEKVTVISDVELTRNKAFGQSPGIVVLSGTGSIALGKNKRGKIARAGGLGHKLGDEGSGYWIGKMYLSRVLNKSRKWTVAQTATLAPKVIAEAKNGQAESKRIIKEAQSHLQYLLNSVKIKLGNEKLRIKTAGGLFKNSYFRKSFLRFCRTTNSSL